MHLLHNLYFGRQYSINFGGCKLFIWFDQHFCTRVNNRREGRTRVTERGQLQFFALPWSALKKPSWELKFLHIFAVPMSSRHEKCCQILERLFFSPLQKHTVSCMTLLIYFHVFGNARFSKILNSIRQLFCHQTFLL